MQQVDTKLNVKKRTIVSAKSCVVSNSQHPIEETNLRKVHDANEIAKSTSDFFNE